MAHPEPYREPGDWLEAVSLDEKIGWAARGYAEDAINTAKQTYGIELDCSEQSLTDLETILTAIHKSIPRGVLGKLLKKAPTEEELEEVCKTWGAYLGEVMRLNVGTRWVAMHPDANGWDYNMQYGETWMWPIEKIRKRLLDGAGDEPRAYYFVLKELIQQGSTG